MRSLNFTRWILHPAEIRQMSSSRAVRAAHLPSAQTPISTVLAHQRLLNSQIASRRSLTTNVARSPRPMVCSRPGLRPVQLPKQRRNCRHHSGSSSNTSKTQKEGGSLSQRLRRLSREYGWSALGVYFALSALDFPFCFAAVRLLGVDRIGHLEHVVVQAFKNAMHTVWPQGESEIPDQAEVEGVVTDKQGRLAQAESQDQEEASIWTQLALAYAVHKSLIFIRVPLTAAVTPKVVKTLRRWGWDIGKRKPKNPSP